MNTVNPVQNHTLVVTSGQTVSFSDADYDYRYYRLVGLGDGLVGIELNGTQEVFVSGYTYLDAPIYSLTVTSGAGVMLFGTKSVRQIFGN